MSLYPIAGYLFSRALFFTNLLSLAIFKEVIFTNFCYGQYSICVILSKYFKVLYFVNLVCTMKFLKYKSHENFQLYGSTQLSFTTAKPRHQLPNIFPSSPQKYYMLTVEAL